jgi:hypothetical protein
MNLCNAACHWIRLCIPLNASYDDTYTAIYQIHADLDIATTPPHKNVPPSSHVFSDTMQVSSQTFFDNIK